MSLETVLNAINMEKKILLNERTKIDINLKKLEELEKYTLSLFSEKNKRKPVVLSMLEKYEEELSIQEEIKLFKFNFENHPQFSTINHYNTHTQIINNIKSLLNNVVEIGYTKKNGEYKVFSRATRNPNYFEYEFKNDENKVSRNPNMYLISLFDLRENSWKTIDARKIDYIKIIES